MSLRAQPITGESFAPFGDVVEVAGAPDMIINQGRCGRYHNRARLDFSDGQAGLSVFDSEASELPHAVAMMERHPLGSQAFVPLNAVPFLVVVARDQGGEPKDVQAFLTEPGQSVNLLRGVWHGVLAPIGAPGRYVVIDRIGGGKNLEEHWFDAPVLVSP